MSGLVDRLGRPFGGNARDPYVRGAGGGMPEQLWAAAYAAPNSYLAADLSLLGAASANNNSSSVLWDGHYIWSVGNGTSQIIKIDPASRTVVGGPWSLGGYVGNAGNAIAFDGTNYWAAGGTDFSVIKWNSSGGLITTVTGITGTVRNVIYDGAGSVWAGPARDGKVLTKISTTSNTIVGSCTLTSGTNIHGPGCSDGMYIWQSYYRGTGPWAKWLAKIRISDATIVGDYDLSYSEQTNGFNQCPTVYDGANLWCATWNGVTGYLLKVRASDGAVIGTYGSFYNGINGLACDGTYVYVGAAYTAYGISKVRCSDGVTVYSAGSAPGTSLCHTASVLPALP